MTAHRLPDQPDFRVLFESVPGLYLVLSPELVIVAVSDAYLRATMTERAEILGRALFDVFPDNPDDLTATGTSNLRASLERVRKHRVPDAMAVQKYDIRRPHAEGGGFEERFWSPVNSPVLSDTGDVRYIIHRVEDVTEFVRLKQQGTEQERIAEEFRTHASRMEAEVFRRAQEIQEANRELRELQAQLELRVEARTEDLVRSNQALRRSEEQLRQAQKLEAIGRLAGGVAHDFNNLLTAIMGHSHFLHQRFESDDPAARDAEDILKAAERAASLTRQLLAFSRQQILEPKVLDLNVIITDLDRMLRRLIGEDIDLVTAPLKDLGQVKADPGQIEQVLINLVVNARDAMPDGGKLTIETANVDLDEGYAQARIDLTPGRYVMVAVSDNGCGMSRETASRIFEPFFTTKPMGQGTGLGLSTVHGIVKQSEGHIEVYTELGQGTTFKVYLPRVEEVAEDRPVAQPEVLDHPGHGTILLVEDEDIIRRVIVTSLRMSGYTVIEATDGSDAISVCENRDQPIDLLITDIVMPLMSGPELVRRVRAVRPRLPTLLISGYTDRALVHQGIRGTGMAFLQKPFTPDVLARKVREVLDGEKRAAA
jgi:signal transduction histidine kinase/ActR/RegA family two-component response regulator